MSNRLITDELVTQATVLFLGVMIGICIGLWHARRRLDEARRLRKSAMFLLAGIRDRMGPAKQQNRSSQT